MKLFKITDQGIAVNRKILNSIKKSTRNLSNELISVAPEFESKDQIKTGHTRIPDQDSVLELISDLSDKFNNKNANESTNSLKELIISNIIITFGLNRIENKNIQDGGLVTTELNAKKGIYANENQTFHRNEYVGYKYRTERDKYKKQNNFNGKIKDTYTGKLLNSSEIDIDHITSVNAIHQEYGFMLTTEDRSKIGSNAGNFAATSASLNRSKRDQKLSETAIKHNLDRRRTNAAEKRSEKSLNDFKPDIIGKISYYTSNGIKTSIEQGFSSGVHIMIGEFLKELILISFEKIQDLGSKTTYTSTFKYITEIIKKLIETLGDVAKKWSSIMSNAADGFVSSFISNITTIIVNSIYSTASNIIRMIKQGFYSG